MTAWAANADDEYLLRSFYEWELRGRGWEVWQDAILPEPPFAPFPGHRIIPHQAHDDGRRHTLVSGLIERCRGLLFSKPQQQAVFDSDLQSTPEIDDSDAERSEIQIVLSDGCDLSKELSEQFLLSISACRHPVSFEIVSIHENITLQFTAQSNDIAVLNSQLIAHFPDVSCRTRQRKLQEAWSNTGDCVRIAELGLGREFMLPLMPPKGLRIDMLVALVAALEDISQNEIALLQVLFAPVRHAWSQSILRSTVFPNGEPFFDATRDFVAATRFKISRPLFACVLRIACRAEDEERVAHLAHHLATSMSLVSDPQGNELMLLNNEGYEIVDHEHDLLARRTHRSGMLLNSLELASFVHLPSASVQSKKLRGMPKQTKRAPTAAFGNALTLGENGHAGEQTSVTLSSEQRSRHIHMIGASGTGKSQLLLNMIAQDIEHGEGLAVLDPHGDLIEEVLTRIPDHRLDDVIILDPSDNEYTIGFNILEARSEIEKSVLASDLVAVFQRLSTSWGDQMTSVFGNAILAFLERPETGSLADLRRFLIESPFRAQILSTVTDPEVVYYWKKQFPLLRGNPQASVLTRLDMFLRRKPIRQMVCQQERTLDFAKIMDTGLIFLAKIPQGLIGDENARLLGTLLVSKFHQVAMARQEKAKGDRRQFYLYVDEFHHFVTPSMASILCEARKYRLGLILAHQELRQLDSRGTDIASAVLSNPYTRICFRVGDQDAKKLADGFSFFEAADLQSLGTGEAICRIERADFDFNLKTTLLPAMDERRVEEKRTQAIQRSRELYAILRSKIKEELPAESDVPEVIPAPSTTSVEPMVRVASQPIDNKPKREISLPDEPALMGRGGPQHKYLQQLIKQWAEGMGYRGSIEKALPKGRSVDVLLEKGSRSIACETSLTTTPAWEVGNIRKCLDAGFDHIAVVSVDEKRLGKIKSAATDSLSAEELKRVQFFLPDALFAFIQALEVEDAAQEKTVRGYRVKTSFTRTDADEQIRRKAAVTTVVATAMRRLRQKR